MMKIMVNFLIPISVISEKLKYAIIDSSTNHFSIKITFI